jgi:hypothetical protein
MQYFALGLRRQARCPEFVNGMLHEEFSPGGADRPMDQPWHFARAGSVLAPLPPELWLITKDRAYDFGLRSAFGGQIVSAELFALMQRSAVGRPQVARLHTVSAKGLPVPGREYVFVKYPRSDLLPTEELVDFDRSRIDRRRGGDLKKVWELAFRRPPERDLFLVDSIALLGVVFCSERFAEAARELDVKGVEFVPLPEIGTLQGA